MPHATATINGIQVASTDTYEVVDGNIYFPPSSVSWSHFRPTLTKTHCPYKGDASYFSVATDKTEVKDVAWSYQSPKEEGGMGRIKGFVAFYGAREGVEVKGG